MYHFPSQNDNDVFVLSYLVHLASSSPLHDGMTNTPFWIPFCTIFVPTNCDHVSWDICQVFDGSSTSPAAAKTTEALELSQALRRVRATRRSRRHSGGDDERTRRRNARSAAGTDATGDARPQSRTQGMQPLKGGGDGENGGQEDQREGGSGGGESGFGATEGIFRGPWKVGKKR